MKVYIGPYRKNRKIDIRIDEYDTYSMDTTLAMIILPMLKQLKDTKHGSALVEQEDVPYEMRTTNHSDYDWQMCFDFYHESITARYKNDVHDLWDWVLDEMIWAFEQIQPDCEGESQFYSGESDFKFQPIPKTQLLEMVKGPNHTLKVDREGLDKYNKRIKNGLRLFGKYYMGLWD